MVRKYRNRRRMTAHSTALVPMRRRKSALARYGGYGKSYAGAAAGRMSELEAAYHVGSFMLDNYKKASSRLKLGQAKVKN